MFVQQEDSAIYIFPFSSRESGILHSYPSHTKSKSSLSKEISFFCSFPWGKSSHQTIKKRGAVQKIRTIFLSVADSSHPTNTPLCQKNEKGESQSRITTRIFQFSTRFWTNPFQEMNSYTRKTSQTLISLQTPNPQPEHLHCLMTFLKHIIFFIAELPIKEPSAKQFLSVTST